MRACAERTAALNASGNGSAGHERRHPPVATARWWRVAARNPAGISLGAGNLGLCRVIATFLGYASHITGLRRGDG
jgi:hypothetical protein